MMEIYWNNHVVRWYASNTTNMADGLNAQSAAKIEEGEQKT